MDDIEIRRSILQYSFDHRHEHELQIVNIKDIKFLAGRNEVQIRHNIKFLEDQGLIKTEDSAWTIISITTDGIILVEDTKEFNRRFPLEQINRNIIQKSNFQKLSVNQYIAFIVHAYEDKSEIASPLANALMKSGLNIWYDDFVLRIGDSLRRSIDRGLANSQYGIVILSQAFFIKEWPQKELDGLVAKEVDGKKVILPIWHNVTREDVLKYSPILADKVASNTAGGLQKVIKDLLVAMDIC